MSASLPFDRIDLPHATRVVTAPVDATYAAVAEVVRWPAWFPQLLEPVITKSPDRYLFRARRDGRIEHHEGHVVVRGTTHTFGIQVGEGRLWFRTRPNPPGTRIDVVLEPPDVAAWRARIGRARRRQGQERWVAAVVGSLADHLERED